jgi:hypothetical protein
MKVITNGINESYLIELLENAPDDIEMVKAAVAYASDDELLKFCLARKIPLMFYGRMDHSMPVSLPILKKFLTAGPSYQCKLVYKHYHPKVIWLVNYGAYIGSANLSRSAWTSNVECGIWFTEGDLKMHGIDVELVDLFEKVEKESEVLTEELFNRLKVFADANKADQERESLLSRNFDVHIRPQLSKDFKGLARIVSKHNSENRKRKFLEEWNSTLQTLRKLSDIIVQDANRPAWIKNSVPKGVQVDQFLHAYYYQNVKINNQSYYEEHYQKNRGRTDQALKEAFTWWHSLAKAPGDEDKFIYERAPFLLKSLSRDEVTQLSEDQFIQVCQKIHAFLTASRQTTNNELGFPKDTKLELLDRAEQVAKWIWNSRSGNGSSPLQVFNHILYGGSTDDVPHRVWDAAFEDDWHLQRFGLSCIGELVGWAMPDKYPPRNGRTSKALRALGFDVKVYSE